ncbi:MAG: glycosyltransferase [Calothrix sp. MO_167.B12]|nr:glycosyltransferase [Calothrix sp. MO_167.B12]
MKITIVSHEMPYPPNHGARVDIWRRIQGISQLGVEIQLITWVHQSPTSEELTAINQYVKQTHFIVYQKNTCAVARKIIDLFSYPLEVTSRIVRGEELENLISQVSNFHPDAIFLDGIHGGELAMSLGKKLNVPLVTRSHNIEHLYHQRLLLSATGLAKLKKQLSLTNLESYEKYILKSSAIFYDISADDLSFWQKQGLTSGRYLPPLIDFTQKDISEGKLVQPRTNYPYDIVFLGNLNNDNNVAGIVWFLTNILPKIYDKFPEVKVLIAGSNPVPKIKQICTETPEVDIKINPVSADIIYQSGKVLINPIFTGSGVSIKSIEMLAAKRPIVSTPQGIAGLPQQLHDYFNIADNANDFAEAICKCLSNSANTYIEREILESLFGLQAIASMLSEIKSLQSS